MRYREKPKFVEAEQWFPGKTHLGVIEEDRETGSGYTHAWIELKNHGPYPVSPGDWIVRDGGITMVMTDRLFNQRFETASEIEPIDLDNTPEPQSFSKVETEVIRRVPQDT